MAQTWRWVLFLVAGLLAPAAHAQFHVSSQNTLHFGWGTTNPNSPSWNPAVAQLKTQSILRVMGLGALALPQGVLMLQEVMPIANLGFFAQAGCTGTCTWVQSPSYGRGWYRETYVYIINDPAGAFANLLGAPCQGAICGSFSRPPMTLGLTVANQAIPYYLVNFHAIWGQTQAQRIREAMAMAILVRPLAVDNLIVGGDWNLDAGTVAQSLNIVAACISPAGATTLNPAGAPSSSYDHFLVMANANCVTTLNAQIYPPAAAGAFWRQNVSDHVGIGIIGQ